MTRRFVRVVKVGGSLFDSEGLPGELDRWLQRQTPPDAANVLVAGGGAMADVIRTADRLYRIGDEQAHWLCIRILGVSARLLATLLPDTRLIDRFDDLNDALAASSTTRIVFDAEHFLRSEEPLMQGNAVPHDWRTTSDSIAARLAAAIAADELVLIKARDTSANITLEEASKQGLVDEFFPLAAAPLGHTRWVRLREAVTESRLK